MMDDVARDVDEAGVRVVRVDGEAEKALAEAHNVRGFPTLLLVRHERPAVEYTGRRSLGDMVAFARRMVGPAVVRVDAAGLDKVRADAGETVFVLAEDAPRATETAFRIFADRFRHAYRFVQAPSEPTMQACYPHTPACRPVRTDAANVDAALERAALPLLAPITQSVFHRYVETRKLFAIVVLAADDDEGLQEARAVAEARADDDVFIFGTMDPDDENARRFLAVHNVTQSRGVVVLDSRESNRWLSFGPPADGLDAFLAAIAAGALPSVEQHERALADSSLRAAAAEAAAAGQPLASPDAAYPSWLTPILVALVFLAGILLGRAGRAPAAARTKTE